MKQNLDNQSTYNLKELEKNFKLYKEKIQAKFFLRYFDIEADGE